MGEGAELDPMVHAALPKVPKTAAPTDVALCGPKGEHVRELESQGEGLSLREGPIPEDPATAKVKGSRSQGQEQGNGKCADSTDGRRRSLPGRVRDAAGDRVPCRERSEGRCSVLAAEDAQHGKHVAADCCAHSSQERARESLGSVNSDMSTDAWETLLAAGDPNGEECFQTDMKRCESSDTRHFHEALKQINEEFESIKKQYTPGSHNRKKICLFEVFCSPVSRLAQQVESHGGSAVRYHRDHTDLMSCEGRKVLFHDLLEQCPEHVWFAPECGPWSAWSNFNQSKSIDSWWSVQQKRWQNMSQLALGVVLLRHQRSQGKHLHWEQPNRSNMFRTPLLQEVYAKTVAAEFDMCNLGDLKDPMTGMAMKKGMTILTTSKEMQKLLHGHRCRHDHVHQPLEGTTVDKGRRISRTSFSENYPRKFARRVAQHLSKIRKQVDRPVDWETHEALATSEIGPAPKRRRMTVTTARLRPRKGSVRSDEGRSDPPPKKLRITGKGGIQNSGDKWQDVFDQITPELPRVGKREIVDSSILQKIQDLVPEKRVIQVIGGRGLNRTTAPIRSLAKGEAPYRKLVYIHRKTNKFHEEFVWELWEDLPKRKLVRPGFPSKVAITIFAVNPQPERDPTEVAGAQKPSAVDQSHEMPEAARTPMSSENQEIGEQTVGDEETISENHGPAMMRLSREDRALLMKIHKNAGHPGADKLAYLLRQQGYRPELVAAVPDLACSACAMLSRPKISRPSAIHSPLDFNDVISMDGYTWKNQQGTSFHFYHIVDASTNFQVAKYAPNRSVENAIDCVISAWFSWAGSPNELIVDAATELNAEAFAKFMQQHNVKCSTISTNAHWQNGRAERHGEILGQMLSKYDIEHAIVTGSDLQQALAHCTQAKNALSIRKGYAPEVLVLGKHTRLPGAVCSDSQLPAHALADSEHCHGLLFRENLAKRETARRAFHVADNDAVLRRAILRRSRPSRQWFQKGEWVMVWRGGLNSGWQGPMRVIIQENAQVVWMSQHGKIYRHAPEHVRPVTSLESRQISPTEVTAPLPDPSDIPTIENPIAPNSSEEVPSQAIQSAPIIGPVDPSTEGVSETSEPAGEPAPPESNHSEPSSVIDVTPDASCVPVPEDSHDELVGWHCLEEDNLEGIDCQQAWCGEILITAEDIERWRSEDNPGEMAFLATAAKRQRSEVKLKDLKPEDLQKFNRAKQGEINNWLSTETVKRVFRHQIPEDQILRCRWLLTWKPVEQPEEGEETTKAKARLIVLGYLDPQLEEIPRDSPTMSKVSRMLVLQLLSTEGWDLMSFDVKAAFLQGSQSSRTLGLEPVPELAQALKLKPNEICQLVKGAYGLVDAPYLWYQTLKSELVSLGFKVSPFDPCVFLLYDNQKRPIGVIGIHVDDGLCGGNAEFHGKLKCLEKKYPFGAKKLGTFTFTGIDLHQNPDRSITLSQSKYVRNIKPIPIANHRKTNPEEPVTETERQQLRGIIGSLQYASVHTRPDLASRLSALQSKVNSACVETLLMANKTLHEAKSHHDVSLTVQPIRRSDLRFLAFTDASFASAKVPDSHSGSIILATSKNIESNVSCPVSPIAWGSKKIQKVVTSTLAAETMSLSSNLDMLSWVRLYWAWFHNPTEGWKHPSDTLSELPKAIVTATDKTMVMPPAVAATDCKSLYDLVTRTAPPNCQEFRTQLQTRAIKEQLSEGVNLRWVHSGAQLADALTKVMESHFLRETLRLGRYKLNDETEVLRERACTKTRLKWLKESAMLVELWQSD